VPGHERVEPDDLPSVPLDPSAEFGVFAADERFVVAAALFKCFAADEHVAAEAVGDAGRAVPFDVAEPVVEGFFGVEFAAVAVDRSDFRFAYCPYCFLEPVGVEDGVGVEELHERGVAVFPAGVALQAGGRVFGIERDERQAGV